MKWKGGSKGRAVIVTDLKGNVIGRYPSTQIAALETGFSQNTVDEECLGHTKKPQKRRQVRYRFEEAT